MQTLPAAPSRTLRLCSRFAAGTDRGTRWSVPEQEASTDGVRKSRLRRPGSIPGSCSARQGGKVEHAEVCRASEAGGGLLPQGSGMPPAREGEGGCRCLLRLEAAGSAGVGSARRDWVPLGKCDGLLDQRPPTEGNVQAGVCFAKVIAALVIQQIQRGAKTLTRNARLRGASVAGSAAGPSSCSAAQAAIPRR